MTAVAARRRKRLQRVAHGIVVVVAVILSSALTGALVGAAAKHVAGNRMAPWIIARAAGLCAYLLLVALVLMGLRLSHPRRAGVRQPNTPSRIRLHVSLAAGTLAFTVLHVVALATDRYAGVGWQGAVLPMHAQYRPVATTLGLIGAWSGLLAGVTALLAGHLPRRLWWPIHKVAGVSLVLIWAHGVLGGGDTTALLGVYLCTAALVLLVAISRYAARTPTDLRTQVRP